MSFPDIMVCSTGTKFNSASSLVDVHGKQISTTDIRVENATQQMYHDLCHRHTWLSIFSTKNELMNMTQNEDSIFIINVAPFPNVTKVKFHYHTSWGDLSMILSYRSNAW